MISCKKDFSGTDANKVGSMGEQESGHEMAKVMSVTILTTTVLAIMTFGFGYKIGWEKGIANNVHVIREVVGDEEFLNLSNRVIEHLSREA